jgi:hypothetical protein
MFSVAQQRASQNSMLLYVINDKIIAYRSTGWLFFHYLYGHFEEKLTTFLLAYSSRGLSEDTVKEDILNSLVHPGYLPRSDGL